MWLLSPILFLLSLPGCFSIQGPESVRGRERGSLTVWCHYRPGWKAYKKYWCRGAQWLSCRVLVETRGSEQEVKKDSVSIRDNWKNHSIVVTMQDLRQHDNDTYWCGIKKPIIDLGASIQVMVVPGKVVSKFIVNSYAEVFFSFYIRNHYMLLVFVKVPILLLVVGAVLWLKEPRRVPEKQQEEPIYSNWSCDPTTDTAP
ncbi:CMRF35-like molecule 7 [Sturnira hondurensis]|uniref:CMRF35-like molecule 7 n=1 Tax=Sturnira hondurensis TaxID=192404 RepID=UPI00187AF7A9|nr:CMRF35-like molecule 7 [Sturnira hondurensis]